MAVLIEPFEFFESTDNTRVHHFFTAAPNFKLPSLVLFHSDLDLAPFFSYMSRLRLLAFDLPLNLVSFHSLLIRNFGSVKGRSVNILVVGRLFAFKLVKNLLIRLSKIFQGLLLGHFLDPRCFLKLPLTSNFRL